MRLVRSQAQDEPGAIASRSISEVSSSRLRQVFAVWQEKCEAPDRLPAADGFDILDYRAAIGNTNLIEVRSDPLDFVFRVHSANGAKYVGRDLTGRSVDEYPDPQYRDFVRVFFTRAVQTRRPQIVIEELDTADNRRMRWEGIIMPMQDEAGKVTRLIVSFEILH